MSVQPHANSGGRIYSKSMNEMSDHSVVCFFLPLPILNCKTALLSQSTVFIKYVIITVNYENIKMYYLCIISRIVLWMKWGVLVCRLRTRRSATLLTDVSTSQCQDQAVSHYSSQIAAPGAMTPLRSVEPAPLYDWLLFTYTSPTPLPLTLYPYLSSLQQISQIFTMTTLVHTS